MRKHLPDPDRLDLTQSLEPGLSHARSFYARALAQLAVQRNAAQGEDAVALKLLFERVAHDAVWAVTELHRGAETKYFRQRFISARARRRWTDASTRGQCGQGVQHEHVVESRKLKLQLAKATTEGEFHGVLAHAVACVVTDQDHDDLNQQAQHLQGWDRYRAAKISVWDRLEQRWHLQLAAGSDAAADTAPHDLTAHRGSELLCPWVQV